MTSSNYLVNLVRRGAGLAPETALQPSIHPSYSVAPEWISTPLPTTVEASRSPTEVDIGSTSTPAADSAPETRVLRETTRSHRVSAAPPSFHSSPHWSAPTASSPPPAESLSQPPASSPSASSPAAASAIAPLHPPPSVESASPLRPSGSAIPPLAAVNKTVSSSPTKDPAPVPLHRPRDSGALPTGDTQLPLPAIAQSNPAVVPLDALTSRAVNQSNPANLASDLGSSPVTVAPVLSAVAPPKPMPLNDPIGIMSRLADPPQTGTRKPSPPPVQVRISRIDVRMTAPPTKSASVTPSKSRDAARNFDRYAAVRRYVDRVWY